MSTSLKEIKFLEDLPDQVLIIDLLTWMHKNKADYTNTFCFLSFVPK